MHYNHFIILPDAVFIEGIDREIIFEIGIQSVDHDCLIVVNPVILKMFMRFHTLIDVVAVSIVGFLPIEGDAAPVCRISIYG